jgi:hypothetical protein
MRSGVAGTPDTHDRENGRKRASVTRATSILIAAVLLVVAFPPPARATDISAGVMAGDPTYRELRLAADLGLLAGPYPGSQPISRAEAFRLLRPLALELQKGTAVSPTRGVTRAVARRLDRMRLEICPWEDFWEKGVYPVTLWGWLPRRVSLNGSEIERGRKAPEYLDYGYDRRQGITAEADNTFFVEGVGFAVQEYGRLRLDPAALTYRPLVLTLRTGWRNFRVVYGREPMSWGPGVHGNLLMSINARPLDQFRLESDSPFPLPGPLSVLGRFTARGFLSHLGDEHRSDAPNPWVTGVRFTWSPARWLLLGAGRTVLLGGEGHEFIITPRSVWNVLAGTKENRVGDSRNDTDQLATVDWSVYLWPVLRPVPLLDGGRLYGEYGGEDSRQRGPFPAVPGHTYGIELVAKGVLLRAEASSDLDDKNLWYWHTVYRDGYTYRGRVIGHPMGGDSRAQSYDVEVPLGSWGLAVATMERQEHGFQARPGLPPIDTGPPIPHGVQDTFKLALERYLGPFPGGIRLEGRVLREWGDPGRLGPLEKWGVTLSWWR